VAEVGFDGLEMLQNRFTPIEWQGDTPYDKLPPT
jgi:hypothetical protein